MDPKPFTFLSKACMYTNDNLLAFDICRPSPGVTPDGTRARSERAGKVAELLARFG